jgi:tol-pal system protein YbgF
MNRRRTKMLPALLASVALAAIAAQPASAYPALQAGEAAAHASRPLILAQTGNAALRVNQLEEQIRLLNGRIEELNFQLLQMQEQMRKMQEDNEFRFQELEQKRGGVDAGSNDSVADAVPGKSQPSGQDEGAQRLDGNTIASVQPGDTPAANQDLSAEIPAGDPLAGAGLQPRNLGSMTFDQDGNLVDSSVDAPIDITGGRLNSSPGDQSPAIDTQGSGDDVASLALPQTPDDLYELGYGYIQSGDYALAENAFEEFTVRYPEDPRISEARFWVGESMFARGMYEASARVFLDAHRSFPQGRLAAQTLLKLGASLAGMNQRELACSTFAEVPRKYPNLSNALKSRLAAEQAAASCKTG